MPLGIISIPLLNLGVWKTFKNQTENMALGPVTFTPEMKQKLSLVSYPAHINGTTRAYVGPIVVLYDGSGQTVRRTVTTKDLIVCVSINSTETNPNNLRKRWEFVLEIFKDRDCQCPILVASETQHTGSQAQSLCDVLQNSEWKFKAVMVVCNGAEQVYNAFNYAFSYCTNVNIPIVLTRIHDRLDLAENVSKINPSWTTGIMNLVTGLDTFGSSFMDKLERTDNPIRLFFKMGPPYPISNYRGI